MKFKMIFKELVSGAVTIVVTLSIAVLINLFVFQISTVSGNSMAKTLHDRDAYVTLKIGNIFNSCPNYGEIVIIDSRVNEKRTFWKELTEIYKYNVITSFFTKQQPRDFWVKRVIGLPGDKLRFSDDGVYRNETLLDEPYVNPDEKPHYVNQEITIPDNHIFVMGDNRNHSSDSRVIGPVPIENVIGVMMFKIKSGE